MFKTSFIKPLIVFIALVFVGSLNSYGQRVIKDLNSWKFSKGDNSSAQGIDFDDSQWEQVIVPHDWAIYGPFDKEIDKQVSIIEQIGITAIEF